MTKATGTGALFPKAARSAFLRISGQTYSNMLVRVTRKGFYGLPFTKAAFRERVLAALGGGCDGLVRCRYCGGFFTLEQIGVDHAIPLSRGGSVDLDNLEFPCRADNNRKGSLTPDEYLKLLDFLEKQIPLARQDVLHRLEISVQLAAGQWARARKDQPGARGKPGR